MKINEQPSFKSRINILSPLRYASKPNSENYIHCFQDRVHNNVVIARDFYTKQVRTCTGGCLTAQDSPLAVGFHIWDELKYFDLKSCIKKIKKLIPDADNGFLIGSKELIDADHSVSYFNEIQNSLSEICPNFSVFKTFTHPYGQADFKYFKDTDTLNIRLSFLKPYCDEISNVYSLKRLLSFFKEISIAPTDTLFINEKQITKKDVPHIFR